MKKPEKKKKGKIKNSKQQKYWYQKFGIAEWGNNFFLNGKYSLWITILKFDPNEKGSRHTIFKSKSPIGKC